MNKHDDNYICYEYIHGNIEYHVRYIEDVFKRYGISEYGEVIR